MKRLLAALLVLTMALGLCGCFRETDPTLLKAAENMEKFNSLSYGILIDMDSTKDGEPFPFLVDSRAELMQSEGLMHMSLHMNLAGKPLNSQIYKQQEGFVSTEYVGTDIGQGLVWEKEEGSILKIVNVVPSEDVLKYISDVESTEETVTLDGHSCTRYLGFIKGPSLKVLLKVVSFMGDAGKELSRQLGQRFDSLKVPVSIYIDDEQTVIRKISLEGKELLEAGDLLKSGGLECASAMVSITYGDFDQITEIVIPQEALNAPEKES